MAQIREIKKRMVAVGTIQRITKTMQMIATAKFTAAVQRSRSTQPYTEKIRELVSAVCSDPSDLDHPLVGGDRPKTGRELLLVIGSDRGFCGAFNSNVLRNSLRYHRRRIAEGAEVQVETSGKKASNFFKFARIPVAATHDIGDKPSFDEVSALADRFMDLFTAGEVDSVHVAYMRFESNSRQIPEIQQLLPLQAPEVDETGVSASMYEFTPDEATLLNDLLPRAVRTSLFQSYNDAVVSEQIMRMIAMKAATDNAASLGRTLKRDYNRARQARITTELTEIVSGAAALA
ncbi:MAG: ATP synthase F1 subunit gamma [Planctomycetota bacterium]|jgi:F-type H+-transporting ATPase subunit gamma|nr:ATP synthase F1 subunit gamma [Planctomycetota bacterium]